MSKNTNKSAAAKNATQAAPEREAPIIEAFALAFVPGQGWTSIVYRLQGEKLLKVEASEPDLKLIAQEKFRQNMAHAIIREGGSVVAI